MITLLIKATDALLSIEPFYTVAAGTDLMLMFKFSDSWQNVAPVAIFTKDERRKEIPLEGGAVRVPLEFVEPSRFTVCLEDRINDNIIMTSGNLDIYIAPTIKGE